MDDVTPFDGDNVEFQIAARKIADEQPIPGQGLDPQPVEPVTEAADMMREGLTGLLIAAELQPLRVFCAVCRLSGLSLRESAELAGMSKQGVQKHLTKLERRAPRLRGIFTTRKPLAFRASMLPAPLADKILASHVNGGAHPHHEPQEI